MISSLSKSDLKSSSFYKVSEDQVTNWHTSRPNHISKSIESKKIFIESSISDNCIWLKELDYNLKEMICSNLTSFFSVSLADMSFAFLNGPFAFMPHILHILHFTYFKFHCLGDISLTSCCHSIQMSNKLHQGPFFL